MGRFLRYWLPVMLYCTAIFGQSHFSGPPGLLLVVPGMDKVAHALMYGLLAVLFYRALRQSHLRLSPWVVSAAAIVSTSLYGLTDELHQHFIPARQADPLDLAADVVGAVAAVWVCRTFFFRKNGGR